MKVYKTLKYALLATYNYPRVYLQIAARFVIWYPLKLTTPLIRRGISNFLDFLSLSCSHTPIFTKLQTGI